MSIRPDQMLSHYRLIEKIGEGGMGVVWRAADTVLDRDVAIKVLPEDLAQDHERLVRFEREAKTLAALSHPNIAAIYGLEESREQRFLVMELVAGEDLSKRLESGRMPLAESLAVCGQVAEGLEAAHEKGVVHRDLKPANIQMTVDGKIKVLDFGLAKAMAPDPISADASTSPTVTSAGTLAGMILGTAGYMSPEQARGQTLDKRTDIFSFGCVLYEALTGRKAFVGETVPDTLARVLDREPDWSALPAGTPVSIERLLRRCLKKDVALRLRDIGDARIEIEEARRALESGEPVSTIATHVPRRFSPLPLLLAGAVGLVLGALALYFLKPGGAETSSAPPTQFSIEVSSIGAAGGSDVAISPSGRRLAWVAGDEDSRQLYIRQLDRLEAEPVPDTDGAEGPVFSPDGEWIAFVAEPGLRKVPAAGGPVTTVASGVRSYGADWGADDTIVFATGGNVGLYRVSAAGGDREPLTTPDRENEEIGHMLPQFLPDGRAVMFTVRIQGKDMSEARVVVRDLDSGEQKTLLEPGSHARYVSTGRLVYLREGALWSVPFDADAREVTGNPVPVVPGVSNNDLGAASFDISEDGTLVYVPGEALGSGRRLVWVDRQGNEEPFLDEPAAYRFPQLSPDGRRLLVAKGNTQADVWVYDLETLLPSRLTFEGHDIVPIWSHDGKRVAFTSDRNGTRQVFALPADGSRDEPELLYAENAYSLSWIDDGLLIDQTKEDSDTDLLLHPSTAEGVPQPLIQTRFSEVSGMFSPDGTWIAFVSTRSDRMEIYIQPYPGPGSLTRVSFDGGVHPVWSKDGRELFYRNGEKIMAASLTFEGTGDDRTVRAGRPVELFSGRYYQEPHRSYDVAADGRFLMIKDEEAATASSVVVVLNWLAQRD